MVIYLENIILENNNINCSISSILENKNINFKYTYTSNSIKDTENLAFAFAKHLKKGDILVLNGELGSGKTVFVNCIGKYFDIQSQVCSPTFNIVNEYDLKDKSKLFHFDVYRIEDAYDFCDSIGTEYFSNGICIIEWGNIIKEILPKNTIYIDIKKDSIKDSIKDNTRYFNIWREI